MTKRITHVQLGIIWVSGDNLLSEICGVSFVYHIITNLGFSEIPSNGPKKISRPARSSGSPGDIELGGGSGGGCVGSGGAGCCGGGAGGGGTPPPARCSACICYEQRPHSDGWIGPTLLRSHSARRVH